MALTVKTLVVAGGGSGVTQGGGGGAGGLIYNASFTVTPQTYAITVGGTHENSVFDTLTAIRGGNGGAAPVGEAGGSGGGAGASAGGTTVGGDADYISPRQGYDGGGNGGYVAGPYPSGGGGGVGGVGSNASSTTVSGKGGDGVSTYSALLIVANVGEDISGVHWIAGGGGGGGYDTNVAVGAAGKGGGGIGRNTAGTATAGTANTGGGGGGAAWSYGGTGGAGGSGVVIISYITANFGTVTITGASNTQTVSGTETICCFKESGNLTIESTFQKVATITTETSKKVAGVFNMVTSPLAADANLQFYMKFEDTWTDSSANAYNLTPTNTPTFVTGKHGKAGNFVVASSQKATRATSGMANVVISTTQSWAFWIKVPTLADNNYLFGISDGGVWFAYTNGVGAAVIANGLSVGPTVGGLSNGVWGHFVFTYDSTAQHLCSYFNGVISQNNVDVTGSWGTGGGSNFGLGIIGDYPGYGTFIIDELMMFNKILTQTEVNDLYGYGKFVKKISGVNNI